MQYVCDAAPYTWFKIDTLAEAAEESRLMNHAVEKYFKRAYDAATTSYEPPASAAVFEQKIGLKGHIERVMEMFVTLRDSDGKAHVTAMLPPKGMDEDDVRPIIVGFENSDPYVTYEDAIDQLADHYELILDRDRCFPYAR